MAAVLPSDPPTIMETPRATKRGGGTDSRGAPPPERQETTQYDAVSWSDLTPELIGRVAIFLAMGNSDIMNLLLCAGPGTAATVRKSYLQGNDYYLDHCIHGIEGGAQQRSKFQCWLDINEKEWKERCHGVTSGSRVHSVSFHPDQVKKMHMIFYSGSGLCCLNYLRIGSDGTDQERVKSLHRCGCHPVLLAVGNTKIIRHTPKEQVASVLARELEKPNEDGKIVLSFIPYLDHIFVSPVVAITNGLTNVLRYLVEEGLATVNDRIPLATPGESCPLLHHAVWNDNSCATLEYLLSCEGIDVNAPSSQRLNAIHICMDGIPASRLKILLRHPNIDVNAQDEEGRTPLMHASARANVSKVKLLVESGANPAIAAANGITPIDILDFFLSYHGASEEQRQNATELIAYLQNYRNARNDA